MKTIEGLKDTPRNKALLESLKAVHDRWRKALKQVDVEGLTVLNRHGIAVPHPAVTIAQSSEREIRLIWRELEFERPDADEQLWKQLQAAVDG